MRCGLLGTEQGDTVASGEKSPAQGNSSTPVGPSRGAGQARSHGRQPAGTAFAYPTHKIPRYPQNTQKTPSCETLLSSRGEFAVCRRPEVRVFVLAVGLGTHGQPFRQPEHTGKSLGTQGKSEHTVGQKRGRA